MGERGEVRGQRSGKDGKNGRGEKECSLAVREGETKAGTALPLRALFWI
jgi:hypothetical protein